MNKFWGCIILVVIIAFIIFKLSIDNSVEMQLNEEELDSFYAEGCIQKVGDNIFLVNEFRMLLRSEVISVDQLTIGNNYRIEYKRILESNPPIVDVINYKELSEEYCN